jgi:hypothetical protein
MKTKTRRVLFEKYIKTDLKNLYDRVGYRRLLMNKNSIFLSYDEFMSYFDDYQVIIFPDGTEYYLKGGKMFMKFKFNSEITICHHEIGYYHRWSGALSNLLRERGYNTSEDDMIDSNTCIYHPDTGCSLKQEFNLRDKTGIIYEDGE